MTRIQGALNPIATPVREPKTLIDLDNSYTAQERKRVDARFHNLLRQKPVPDFHGVGGGSEIINEALKTLQGLHELRVEEMTDRFNGLISKMKELQDEKQRLMTQPLTKEDLIEDALCLLYQRRKEFHQKYLKKHFESVQSRKQNLFGTTEIRVLFPNDNEHGSFYFFLITEDDIREAIASLPDIGMSKKECKKRIAELDKQMAAISDEIKTEYENLKREQIKSIDLKE